MALDPIWDLKFACIPPSTPFDLEPTIAWRNSTPLTAEEKHVSKDWGRNWLNTIKDNCGLKSHMFEGGIPKGPLNAHGVDYLLGYADEFGAKEGAFRSWAKSGASASVAHLQPLCDFPLEKLPTLYTTHWTCLYGNPAAAYPVVEVDGTHQLRMRFEVFVKQLLLQMRQPGNMLQHKSHVMHCTLYKPDPPGAVQAGHYTNLCIHAARDNQVAGNETPPPQWLPLSMQSKVARVAAPVLSWEDSADIGPERARVLGENYLELDRQAVYDMFDMCTPLFDLEGYMQQMSRRFEEHDIRFWNKLSSL